MTDLLNEILNRNNYKTIKVNVPGILLNVKTNTDNDTLVVVSIDESSNIFYTREQFENISRQIRNFITTEHSTNYRFLYIIISEDDNCIKRLLSSNVSYWRIIPSQSRLMVFETACDDFLSLRKPIETVLLKINHDIDYENINNYNATSDFEDTSSFFDKEINPKLAVVNTGIIIINIIVFIIMSLFPLSIIDNISDYLALDWERVFYHGEFYRIITSIFVHSGIDHIFNNMIVLLFTGSYLELALGRINYIIVYLSSGILAGLTSMVYNMSNNNYIQSVGASGAIFGIMGGMVAIIFIKHFHTHNLDLRKILFMAFLSLYGGFTSYGVDNAAHIGGFISGFFISFFIYMIHIKHTNHNC